MPGIKETPSKLGEVKNGIRVGCNGSLPNCSHAFANYRGVVCKVGDKNAICGVWSIQEEAKRKIILEKVVEVNRRRR
jgi:hypothetical protein